MARDHLTPAHKTSLAKNIQPVRRTTLTITLGDGSTLDFATADCELGDKVYLGKLETVDALNMELTGATEGIRFLLTNKNLALGHNLINTPNVLNDLTAVTGCYFLDDETGEEFFDEKLTGKIEIGDIDGDVVQIKFESLTAASYYDGLLISEIFPDEEIPLPQIPAPIAPVYPVYDDLPPAGYSGGGGLGGFGNLAEKFHSRYLMPDRLDTYGLETFILE